MPEPRPLYGLPEIHASTGTIWVVEGEKPADALRSIGLTSTTSPHGAAAADKADWSPLAGREVVIFPDNDEPGADYAADVAEILSKLNPPANVRFVRPEGLPEGGDAYEFCEQRDASEPETIRAELEKLAAEAGGEKPKSGISIFRLLDLIEQYPRLCDPVVDGIIREGEIANLISKTKQGKSWTGYGFGLCVATGRRWLDRFDCRPGTVLLIDNELHPETLAHRIPGVAEAMSIGRDEYRDSFHVCSLRGQSKSILDLKPVFHGNPERYSLVILDALYRAFPEGMSENDNAAMAHNAGKSEQRKTQSRNSWASAGTSKKQFRVWSKTGILNRAK